MCGERLCRYIIKICVSQGTPYSHRRRRRCRCRRRLRRLQQRILWTCCVTYILITWMEGEKSAVHTLLRGVT